MNRQNALSKTRTVKFTYEDYLLFPEDGKRYELMDGERYMSPAPSTKHQNVSLNLSTFLHTFVRRTQAGKVFNAPTDVVLSDLNVVQPDILFVSEARAEIITEKCVQGAPDLVVEILSETTRKTDEIIKRKLYEQHGIVEYLIIDPELETIKVYRMTDQGYIRTAELTREAGDRLATPLLPGLAISLSDIFK